MTKYSLSLIASGIAMSIAFVQCNAPATTEVQVTSQLDTTISVTTSEVKKDTGETQIDKPQAIVISNPKATTVLKPKATLADRPKATTVEKPKATTTEKPKAITVDNPEVTTVDNPEVTTEKPTALISAGFSLKAEKATVNGTSTLHGWESKVTIMEGKGSFQLKDNVLVSIKDAEIKIAVNGIKSEEGTKMDNKTYEAFESDKYPYIIYSFSNAIVKINDSNVVSIETTGNLSMAGERKSVSLLANGKELPNGDMQLTVSKTIKMTDFNMKPPVMFLGTIKVGDEITVSFDFVLSKN